MKPLRRTLLSMAVVLSLTVLVTTPLTLLMVVCWWISQRCGDVLDAIYARSDALIETREAKRLRRAVDRVIEDSRKLVSRT